MTYERTVGMVDGEWAYHVVARDDSRRVVAALRYWPIRPNAWQNGKPNKEELREIKRKVAKGAR